MRHHLKTMFVLCAMVAAAVASGLVPGSAVATTSLAASPARAADAAPPVSATQAPRTAEATTTADPARATPGADAADAEEPRDLGISDQTRAELTQIDVTVAGPPERIAALTPEDFKLKINLKRVRDFTLDRLCELPSDPEQPVADDDSDRTASSTRPDDVPPGGHYVLYFDQAQLTLSGRNAAITMANELVEKLTADGGKVMLVSNAGRLKIVERFTDDPSRLQASLSELRGDFEQVDFFPNGEISRINDVVDELSDIGIGSEYAALGLAREFMKEEQLRATRSMRRLALSLSILGDVPSPKAMVYFADNLRANAGEHYMRYFGARFLATNAGDAARSTDATLSLDGVIAAAVAQGIRFYPVKPDGLSARLTNPATPGGLQRSQANPAYARSSQEDAQNTLLNLASETGGEAFVFGARATNVSRAINEDFSCVIVLSIDPANFRADTPYSLKVAVKDPDIKVGSRGRIVFQSRQRRETAELLAAFVAPELTGAGFGVQAHVIPTGVRGGRLTGLLQIAVPATALTAADWELGASIHDADAVREEISTRVELTRPGVPVIYEREIELGPGEYDVVFVARENQSGVVESDQIQVEWRRLRSGSHHVGPVSLLQPSVGLFLRGDDRRERGSLAIGVDNALDPSRPTAMIGIVCTSQRRKDGLRIERRLTGPATVDFEPIAIPVDAEGERCAQVRDLVPAGGLSPGRYRYDIVLMQDERELERVQRLFVTSGFASDASDPATGS